MLVYSDRYNTDLSYFGIDKPFALDRGALVLKQLARDQEISGGSKRLRTPGAGADPISGGLEQRGADLITSAPSTPSLIGILETVEPEPISDEDILLVHSKDYLDSLRDEATWHAIFELKENEYRPKLAIQPLSMLLDDIRLKCGGTKLACRLALEHGLAANLGGGYHHAFPNQGRGFCVLNDIAIAIRALRKDGSISRALVVDFDFHHGDGTALIFQDDPDVFTYSVHSQEGWPEEKQHSDLDIEIKETESSSYLERAQEGLLQSLKRFKPDLAIYVAGSDPYEKDVLPGTRFINLSLETLEARDKFVIDTLSDRGIPCAMVFAGGYGPFVWEVHYRAVRHLLFKQNRSTPSIPVSLSPISQLL